MARKLGIPLRPSIVELDFGHASAPPLPHVAVAALAAINRHIPVTIAEVHSSGEWFRLESYDLHEADLFKTVKRHWPLVSGRNILDFSLVFCENGPDRGVWLHHLSNEEKVREHLPGCHRIASWS